MKLNLFEKAVESLDDLRNMEGYAGSVKNYKITLTPQDRLYVINTEADKVVFEIKDERTIVNYCPFFKEGGYAHHWQTLARIFKNGLEKRTKRRIEIHNKETYDLYQKIDEAVKEIKQDLDHRKAAKEFMTIYGTRDNVYVYDCGTIVFEMKDEKKLTNMYKVMWYNPEWKEVVNAFAKILEEKFGHRVKIKDKGRYK